MLKAKRVLISGTVQQVFFRQFVKDNADSLALKGHVRNLEDGRVEIFIEGDHESIEKLIALCRSGSKYADVRNIEIKEEKFQDIKDFRILKF